MTSPATARVIRFTSRTIHPRNIRPPMPIEKKIAMMISKSKCATSIIATPVSARRPHLSMSEIADARYPSLDPRPHEALHELSLEEEEGEQERARGHERRRRDDRPVHALVGRREDLQA